MLFLPKRVRGLPGAAAMIVIVCVASGLSLAEEIYRWPLDLPRELSSSFAEYRVGRFHAGIDLRTGGVIGRPVFAADDGYVSRVRCSPWGYGKAVYIQLQDGNSAVYAHLDDFYEELREYVRAAQHAARSYVVDLYPEAGRFPVRRGRQIATSGRTGVGPPHLHYELRDSANRPFNPRLIGIQWPDAVRPVIRGLLVSPDGPDSTVNGGFTPTTPTLTELGGGRYRAAPVTASGRIGLGVDVIDPGNDGLRFGVHVLRLSLEGEELFQVRHDYLSYDNIHHGAVSYHPFFKDAGRFLLLWRWPNNTTALYGVSPGDGWFDVPDRPVELTVEAMDFMGNRAELLVPITPETPVSAPPSADRLKQPEGATGVVELDCHGVYITATARFPDAETRPPALLVESGMGIHSIPFVRATADTWQAALAPEAAAAYLLRVDHPRVAPNENEIHVVTRGASERTLSFDELQVRIQPNSPFGVIYLRAVEETAPRPHVVPRRGRAWRLWPDDTPVDAPVSIALPIPEDAENPARLGLYRDTGRAWRHVGGRREGNRLRADVRQFGVYTLMEDNQPPVITEISPADGYQATTQRPVIRANITDVGSGIARFSITANGRWLLAEYDPDEDRLEWERDHPLTSGPNDIEFRVTDNAGNVATARRAIHIP